MPDFLLFLRLVLLLSAFSSHPQAAQQEPPSPTIRATSRLVQVEVAVEDSSGKPISGLTSADFTVFDQNKPQTVSVFTAPRPPGPRTRYTFPKNVFTNRFDLTGEDPGTVNIVLFDTLNTSAADQIYVRRQVLRFLQNLKATDHVAVYALTTQLIVLHDFTRDSAALVSAVNDFVTREQSGFDASHPETVDLVRMTGNADWLAFQNSLNNVEGMIADQATIDRASFTSAALEAIAEHVTQIAGRKNLIWISGGFPIQIGATKIGTATEVDLPSGPGGNPRAASGRVQSTVGPQDPTNKLPGADRDTRSLESVIQRATVALNRVNVAIYPVDARGVESDSSFSAGSRGSGPSLDSTAFTKQQETRDSSRQLADRTGGIAFFGNNNISDALTRAVQDSQHAYTLGFYPTHAKWDGTFHEIRVQSKIPGAHLRYRRGYFASAHPSDTDASVSSDLRDTALSPLAATGLGMIVEVASANAADNKPAPVSPSTVTLRIAIDPKQLLLRETEGRRDGSIDMLFVQRDSAGKVLSADKQHLDLKLPQAQYESLSRSGLIVQRHVAVNPQISNLTVVIRDSGSGALGSTEIPASALTQSAPSAASAPPH